MAVTIKDVARAAQTSTATVSKVMNGSYSISEETALRVKKAMEELQKDSQLKKMMENNLGALFINQSWIDLYWTNGVPKGFEEWPSNSQYQKLIYVRENQKPLLLDSPGL